MSEKDRKRQVAVGYVRVSTAEQVKRGWSLGEQRRRIKAYCDARDWTLRRVYADEGVSGKNGVHRPGFERMIHDVEADGVRYVVALKLDRLGRSALALLTLYDRFESKGAALVLVEDSIDTSTPQGRLLRTVLAGVAEFERDTIVDRLKEHREAKAEKGGYAFGAPPFGYLSVEGELVPDPNEQRVIERIKRLRSFIDPETRRPLAITKIAAVLEADGYHPRQTMRPGGGRRGDPDWYDKKKREKAEQAGQPLTPPNPPSGRWHPQAIARILKREGVE